MVWTFLMVTQDCCGRKCARKVLASTLTSEHLSLWISWDFSWSFNEDETTEAVGPFWCNKRSGNARQHRGLRNYKQRDLRAEPVRHQSRGTGGYSGQSQNRRNEARDLDKEWSERITIALPVNSQWQWYEDLLFVALPHETDRQGFRCRQNM